jgi:hypothetical protein
VDDTRTITDILKQVEDDILASAVSDDALEAASGQREGRFTLMPGPTDCRCC